MSLDEDGVGIRPLLDGTLECVLQVFLVCSVVDDRDTKTIVVSKVSLLLLTITLGNTLDLLEFLDFKDVGTGSFAKQSYKDSVLAVGVNAATRSAQRKGSHEEGCACRGLQHLWVSHKSQLLYSSMLRPSRIPYRRSAQVFPSRIVHDKQILRLHELFLNAGGRNIDTFAITNRGAAASSSDLSRDV